jgi:hypothetical protein
MANHTRVHFILSLFLYNTRIFQKCTKSNEELPKMHKIPGETSKYAQNAMRIFRKCTRSHDCIWKFFLGFCAFLEVPRGIVYIREFLVGLCTFWKLLLGFCRGTSKNAENLIRNFQKNLKNCTTSCEFLPKMKEIT